jgi:hypothetical protein
MLCESHDSIESAFVRIPNKSGRNLKRSEIEEYLGDCTEKMGGDGWVSNVRNKKQLELWVCHCVSLAPRVSEVLWPAGS